MRCFPGTLLMQALVVPVFLYSLSMPFVMAYDKTTENNGRKILKTCGVALEYLANDNATGDIESVRFCDDYLTGFRENENIKEIQLRTYYRGYCFPKTGITNGELARVIVDYLQSNENEQSLAAYTAIRDALVDGYPCTN